MINRYDIATFILALIGAGLIVLLAVKMPRSYAKPLPRPSHEHLHPTPQTR